MECEVVDQMEYGWVAWLALSSVALGAELKGALSAGLMVDGLDICLVERWVVD